jgi:hypothetical protein
MRKFYLLVAGLCMALGATAQTDTTVTPEHHPDTLKIGNLIIIKKNKGRYEKGDTAIYITRRKRKNENVSTNWWIMDFGFSNYNDKTNYGSAATQSFVKPTLGKDDFKLRTGKSINVNIWIFMQRLNVIKHVVNLKYGMGLELNNYRYDNDADIFFRKKPLMIVDTALGFTKNKLAADYLTVPLMLNFNFTPKNENHKSFGFSAGVSAGYLYSARQKYITGETGKKKTKGELGLRPFKISYIAELQLGPVKLYGSMATQSMFEKGLDQTPFNVGLRLSNW